MSEGQVPPHPSALPRSRTIRVVELSSSSTRSERDRRESLKDLNPKDFSLNDGSIRFICALTAELCSQSTSSFSRPIRSARQQTAGGGLRIGRFRLLGVGVHRSSIRRLDRPH
jgi:hypothetical protein